LLASSASASGSKQRTFDVSGPSALVAASQQYDHHSTVTDEISSTLVSAQGEGPDPWWQSCWVAGDPQRTFGDVGSNATHAPMRSLAETGPVLGRTSSRGRLVALSALSKLTFEFANDRQFELLQCCQQMFGCLQIGRIQAFRKLFEYRLQNSSRAISLFLRRPERRQVDRSAQLP
jgi:hypothetical protein